MKALIVGMLVMVGPNTQSLYPPDRTEKPWEGRVLYVEGHAVGVEPLDGGLPRDVLDYRVTPVKQ